MELLADYWPLVLAALLGVIVVTSVVRRVAKVAFVVVSGFLIFGLVAAQASL